MKLDEVAGSTGELAKCGIILPAGIDSIDGGDWHGSTQVYTNKTAFMNAVKKHFMEHIEDSNDVSGERFEAIKKAKSLDALADAFEDDWDGFIRTVWIDDRF